MPLANLPGCIEGHARAADGEALRYRLYGAGPGTPLLLYNGMLSSGVHWPFFLRYFARRRRVIFWDYRGHGGLPPPPDPRAISVPAFAGDAHAVVKAVAAGPAIGVALSFGVQVALEHWRARPADLRALVLVCGTDGHPLDRLSRARWLRRGAAALFRALGRGGGATSRALGVGSRRLGRELAYLSGAAHRSECPMEILDEVLRHSAAVDPAVVGRVIAAYLEHSARDVPPTVSVPTLILAGDRDELTPVSCAERMQAAIPGARLVVYRGHSHLVQVERPEEVHAEIDRFLRDHAL